MAKPDQDLDRESTDGGGDSGVQTLELNNVQGLDDVDHWPCLTILYHPDLQRVGELAIVGQLLSSHPLEISRNSPDFAHPGSAERRGLRDPYVSRTPVRLTRIDHRSLEIAPGAGVHLTVDGRVVSQSLTLRISSLASGVMLGLSRRIVLILHTVQPSEGAPAWGLVGESDGILEVKQKITQVADLDVPVLVRGETGVGKERVAQAIHVASRRSHRPCNSINMATITPSTAASELFGHVRGAFTGAAVRHTGLFERADGGTLFLDEIGETPTAVQAMLLRALSEGTIMAVGDQVERTVDVRVIAATDANIEEGGTARAFRAALFHRLSGYEIRVPPLRERRVDIGRLVVHFLQKELDEIGESWRMDPSVTSRHLWFPPDLMVKLFRHEWPGNVRQLGNVVRQLVISSRGNKALRIDESVDRALAARPLSKSQLARKLAQSAQLGHGGSPDDHAVYQAMEASEWKIHNAARLLGIPRTTLYHIVDRHPDLRRARDLSRDELEHWIHKCGGDLDEMVAALKVSRRGIKLRIKDLELDWEDD